MEKYIITLIIVAIIIVCVHPEPFLAVRENSTLRVIKITTLDGTHYWQVQKRIVFNKWVDTCNDMCLYYEDLRYDNAKSALEFIDNHTANKVAKRGSKVVKREA